MSNRSEKSNPSQPPSIQPLTLNHNLSQATSSEQAFWLHFENSVNSKYAAYETINQRFRTIEASITTNLRNQTQLQISSNAELNKNIETIQSDVKKLHETLTKTSAANQTLVSEVKTLTEQNKSLQSTVESYKQKLETLETKVNKAINFYEKCKKQIKTNSRKFSKNCSQPDQSQSATIPDKPTTTKRKAIKTGISTPIPAPKTARIIDVTPSSEPFSSITDKQLANNELSIGQQVYYKEITEACIGSDEARRTKALQSLSNDPGINDMLPRLCSFILENAKTNVAQCNLTLLTYLMRMVQSLLENRTLQLEEKYLLNAIIPSVAACIVSKQLCAHPERDNHWGLRDFAARLMAKIFKDYINHNVRQRIPHIFFTTLSNEESPLSSVYGSLAGFGELGYEAIKAFIIPKLKEIGNRLELCIQNAFPIQRDIASCKRILILLGKVVAPVLKAERSPSDTLEEYKAEFGYLAESLYSIVTNSRNHDQNAGNSTNTTDNRPSYDSYQYGSDTVFLLKRSKNQSVIFGTTSFSTHGSGSFLK